MKKLLKVSMLMLIVSSLLLVSCAKKDETAAAPSKTFVTIGTGGVTGVYYPTGGAISKMVNQKFDDYNIKATVESTAGSVFNVNAIMAGDLEFGVVQSDRQYQAYNGTADWEDAGAQEKLRAVFSIHPESVTMLAADDAGIEKFTDIKGKIINIGNPGSGQRGNAIDVMEAYGIDWESDIRAESLKASEAAKMLQDGRIDAYFYTVGHPDGSFKEATSGKRKAHFVPITEIEGLLADYPYYAASFIPVSEYPNATNSGNVDTFGVKATLCTSSDVSDDVVYAITKEVFENLDDFKKLHPAFAILTAESMLTGLSAPIHDGAMKYFKEAGLK
ncbi:MULTISPECIES: TAXI family TRAP transporter solute-binding subunit [unclassified Oceanispirochaeta]|uniref:TAXI family TRAP transporter solute-binding subunit n=1 Tax=unclassified Oceanispirochaeta TaxID=2635722 RepID=UPI000E09CCB7|nr:MULTISPECIES: TAXI family TRAP transporter solute-binding subunit [unclassified Oceanispirochaeta]MBF9016433.1 TAXI family TRAP transporter solute-binding subunit [Oceanispirochaeta sp. M2]NPD72895.1 TAXI family TRAP transporter solute-binding subunit [Oceanispirochaeta sp. M1]RDG31472.1 C4-dicarboxylate ABC transporter substrate-binding protein [Oceanispirochaeta sp. M1]